MKRKETIQKLNRVLVISFDPFSLESSNGRTIGNYFKSAGNDVEIAQFFIKPQQPDLLEARYFLITDNDALKTAFSLKLHYKKPTFSADVSPKSCESIKKRKKTPIKCILRNLVWNIASLYFEPFLKWVDDFQPTHILLQAGDLPFQYKLAVKLSKKFNSKLAFYTTEDYPLKKNNYMDNRFKKSISYNLFHRQLFKAAKKMR